MYTAMLLDTGYPVSFQQTDIQFRQNQGLRIATTLQERLSEYIHSSLQKKSVEFSTTDNQTEKGLIIFLTMTLVILNLVIIHIHVYHNIDLVINRFSLTIPHNIMHAVSCII